MATQDDVRRIALSLAATTEDPDSFRLFVDGKACSPTSPGRRNTP
jgi:hypothetical protein